MSVNIENNKKNEAIKEFLAELLEKFEIERKITLHGKKVLEKQKRPNQSRIGLKIFRLEVINLSIKILENIQFKSIDNFDSVKNLKKTELFFKKLYYFEQFKFLKNFKFSDYTSQIDSDFLTYADIEIQLDSLDKKALDLLDRGCRQASSKASRLVTNLRELNKCHFIKKGIEYNSYRSIALELICDAQPILDHPVYIKILVNLVSLLLLGVPCIANKAVNGHYLFFQKSDDVKQLDAISQTLAATKRLSP